MDTVNKAVVTVLGRDTTGIIAKISAVLYKHDANILDITQTVLSGMFSMVMIVDLRGSDFTVLADDLSAVGTSLGLQIRIQRNEIFDAMHRI